MFALNCYGSFGKARNSYLNVTGLCNNIPCVLVGNNCDLKQETSENEITRFLGWNPKDYCKISVRRNINCKEPFLCLARKLTGDDTLQFLTEPAVAPPELEGREDDEPAVAPPELEGR